MNIDIVKELVSRDISSVRWKIANAIRDGHKTDSAQDLLIATYAALTDGAASPDLPDTVKAEVSKYSDIAGSINDTIDRDDLLAFLLYAEYDDGLKMAEPSSSVSTLAANLLNICADDVCAELGNTHGVLVRDLFVRGVNTLYVTDAADVLTYLRADILGVTIKKYDRSVKYTKLIGITPIYSGKLDDSYTSMIDVIKSSDAESALFVPSGFTVDPSRFCVEFRKSILDKLTCVVTLPHGICQKSMVNTSLLVLGRDSDSVTMVDAREIYSGDRRNLYLSNLDISKILDASKYSTGISCISTNTEIAQSYYVISPSKYINIPEVKNAMKLIDFINQIYISKNIEDAKDCKNAVVIFGSRVLMYDPNEEYPKAAYVVDLDSEKLLAKYVYYFLTSPNGKAVRQSASTSVTGILRKSEIESLDIPVVPVAEQIAIIEKAEQLEKTISDAQLELDNLFSGIYSIRSPGWQSNHSHRALIDFVLTSFPVLSFCNVL